MVRSYAWHMAQSPSDHSNGTFGTDNQKWGFVEVRPGAKLFWWLYYTTASQIATKKPLLIFLAGGPGLADSYFFNFGVIGPLDVNLRPRNTSWVHSANVLFVDSPVGVGFSSVESDDLYPTTDEQVADDLVNLLRGFYEAVPDFKRVPVYIFSNSYGGKAAVKLALNIHEAVQNKTLTINLKGVGLGSSWISPIDSFLAVPPYLYQLGFLNTQELKQLTEEGQKVKNLTDANKWDESFAAHIDSNADLDLFIGDVNMYNVQETKKYNFNTTSEVQTLMDEVKTALKLNATWNRVYTFKAYKALNGVFMKPVTDVVERLLNETDISIAVYNGQLDSGTSILGTRHWLNNIHFTGSETYWNSIQKQPITVNGATEGFKEGAGKLLFYTILRAGHYIEKDNPRGVQYILEKITDNFNA